MKPEHIMLLADKDWRLNNLYWITDKEGKPTRFRMTPEQREYFEGIHTRNPRETASVISKRLDVSMSKAKTIAQTEQVGALRQAQWNETDWAADRLGLNTGLLWLSALKPTTRTWHASRHGKVYTTEEVRDFYAENGNRYNCYCSQIPVLLNDDGSIFNEGLADKLAIERKQWKEV